MYHVIEMPGDVRTGLPTIYAIVKDGSKIEFHAYRSDAEYWCELLNGHEDNEKHDKRDRVICADCELMFNNLADLDNHNCQPRSK